jgi:type IV pilus assembly protein PilM
VKINFPKLSAKSVVGLDVGSSTVKAVELTPKSKGGSFELNSLGIAQVAPEAIVQGAFLNSAAITDAIREAVDAGKVRSKNVAAAVSGHSVIVKKVSLPVMTREELDEQIRWEAEQYIPFDVNEVNLDFQILDSMNDDSHMEVLLVAAKKDLIDDYVQVISEAGLTPVAIDVAGFAVENAFEANYDTSPSETVALVNIGAQTVNINVVANGAPSFTRDITTAGNQYTEEIQKALAVSFEEAERVKVGGRGGAMSQDVVPREVEEAMRTVSETVIGEISRSLDFYGATTAEGRIGRVLVSGGSARVAGLRRAFQERTGYPIEVLNPLARMVPTSRFDPDDLQDLAPSLGVAIGLALRRVGA